MLCIVLHLYTSSPHHHRYTLYTQRPMHMVKHVYRLYLVSNKLNILRLHRLSKWFVISMTHIRMKLARSLSLFCFTQNRLYVPESQNDFIIENYYNEMQIDAHGIRIGVYWACSFISGIQFNFHCTLSKYINVKVIIYGWKES